MAFQGTKGTSDKEIEAYLHKNIGDFRPDWQSLYFDLVGMGEMGGLAEIAKKDAVKILTKSYKDLIGTVKPEYAGAAGQMLSSITRNMRRLPQEFLDTFKKLQVERKVSGVFGSYNDALSRVRLSADQLIQRTTEDTTKGFNTFAHEVGHAKQYEMSLGNLDTNLKELHMHLFSDELEKYMKYNPGKVTNESINEIFSNTFTAAKKMDEQGVSRGILSKQIAENRAGTAINPSIEYETAFDVTKSINQNLDDVVKSLGGEMLETTKTTIDDIIEEAITAGKNRRLTQEALELGKRIYKGEVSADIVSEAYKKLQKNEAMDVMERVTTGQYMNEALEMNKILRGETKGLEGKVKWMQDWGILKPEDMPF